VDWPEQALRVSHEEAERTVRRAMSELSTTRETAQRSASEHAETMAQYDVEFEDHFDRVNSQLKSVSQNMHHQKWHHSFWIQFSKQLELHSK
jgi:protoporphyrinogen oxidase